jgi:hypothetical protein
MTRTAQEQQKPAKELASEILKQKLAAPQVPTALWASLQSHSAVPSSPLFPVLLGDFHWRRRWPRVQYLEFSVTALDAER